MNREFNLLVAASGPMSSRRSRGDLSDRTIDWPAVVDNAIAHGVGTDLFRWLAEPSQQSLTPAVPDATSLRLEEHYLSVVAHGMPRVEQLVAVLEALAAARVDAVAFKGPLLEATLGRDPLERESTDLDILIARASLPRAFEALAAIGYALPERQRAERDGRARPRQKHYTCLPSEPSLAMVELHAEVMEPEWAVDLSTADLLRRSVPMIFRGAGLRQLAPADLLLTLSLHGTAHGWRRLMWLADLASLLEKMTDRDVAESLERASSLGCARLLLASCRTATSLFGLHLLPAVASVLAGDTRTERLASRWREAVAQPLTGLSALTLPLSDRLVLRDSAHHTLIATAQHFRAAWHHYADRLSPLRFGDWVDPPSPAEQHAR